MGHHEITEDYVKTEYGQLRATTARNFFNPSNETDGNSYEGEKTMLIIKTIAIAVMMYYGYGMILAAHAK